MPILRNKKETLAAEAVKAPPPPPERVAPRRLSLKTAIAAASRREGADVRPLFSPIDEFPSVKTKSGKQQEMEAHLLELQAEIIVREDHTAQREKKVEARELGLNEREALLQAHRNLVESKIKEPAQIAANGTTAGFDEEAKALKALQRELEAQEASLREARKMLQEREAFIEQCENELVEKSMLLTEREARVEQDEEDYEAVLRRSKLKAVGE